MIVTQLINQKGERTRFITFINSCLKVKTFKKNLITHTTYVVWGGEGGENKTEKMQFRDGTTHPSKLTPLVLLIKSKTLISKDTH